MQVLTCTESHARILERFWYDLLKADLNMIKPYITKEEKQICNAELYFKNKEKRLERQKLYYIENKQKRLEQDKLKYLKNRDNILEQKKQYNLSYKEKIASLKSQRLYCESCELYHRRGDKAVHYKSQKRIANLAIFTDK